MTPDPSTETLAEAVREELPLREVSRITMPAYMRHAIEQTNAAHDALDALAARLSQADKTLKRWRWIREADESVRDFYDEIEAALAASSAGEPDA